MTNRLTTSDHQRVTRSAARAARFVVSNSYREECRRNRAQRMQLLRNQRAVKYQTPLPIQTHSLIKQQGGEQLAVLSSMTEDVIATTIQPLI